MAKEMNKTKQPGYFVSAEKKGVEEHTDCCFLGFS
jgi:hypothetical protein